MSLRPRVLIVHTGGTLSMMPDERGALAPVPGYASERIKKMEELADQSMPEVSMVEFNPLLDSSDMGPGDWVRIGQTIADSYSQFDGFVVVMGTDTMAYASSALSFMLENLSKPVIFTGSVLPLCSVITDARRNIIAAILLAGIARLPEVCLLMDNRLFRANRSTKASSTSLSAFSSPCFQPLATMGTFIQFARVERPIPMLPLKLHSNLETNIAVWRMVPGFDDAYILNAIKHTDSLKAIVLELYGTGNMTTRKSDLLDALRLAISKGILVVAISQCLDGRVSLCSYALGRTLHDMGVLSGVDMTAEAVSAKLCFLLGRKDLHWDEIRALVGKNLRGELTPEYVEGESASLFELPSVATSFHSKL